MTAFKSAYVFYDSVCLSMVLVTAAVRLVTQEHHPVMDSDLPVLLALKSTLCSYMGSI